MVVALSYIFAVIITAALAIVLYPIAAIFWILGIFGRLAEGMFSFTQRAITSLWRDVGNVKRNVPVPSEITTTMIERSSSSWMCVCGAENSSRVCTACGKTLEENALWMCECGTVNKGKFCTKCGNKK